ncbi:MAG TPA: phospholipase D family protein, partial [Solirubrobacteraceae bacterium]|nr:phospholipase D family protein [Solirubrobacteraceae bacterium]
MANALVGRFDQLLGDGLEATVVAKHRRRLGRLGWGRVFEPTSPGVFAAGEPPPRQGCELEVLIDGDNALPEIADAIAAAQQFVHITGWHLEAAFELVRGRPHRAIGVLLAEMAEQVDVRVLVWSGAPVPLFHPTRGEITAELANLTRHTRIQAQGDPKEHPFHCHHEKTVIIDGEVAFVGGIDMTSAGGDRYDVRAHHARRSTGWHDVATRLRGPAVADVNDHFRTRWRELTDEELPAPPAPEPAGTSTVQVVRTVEEDMYDSLPRGDFRIFESYARVLRSARELIYLENQFLWSPELVSIIADKLRHPPTPQFRVVVLLPAKANNGAEDTRGQVGRLIAADDAGDGTKRFLAATIRALSRSHDRADPIYVHAKVAAVDDRWLIVGSANLNAHSLFNDTEMCVVTDDAALARDTRVRLWAEHLEMDEAEVGAAEP